MHIIAKQGNVDNALTYEHICDTKEDMAEIQRKYVTLGSVCIVLQGENGAMEVYMADSSKEWHDIIVAGGNSSEGGSAAGLSLHICTSSEVSNGKPNVSLPLEGVLYLVPSGNTTGNLYEEYVYVNNQWELFGGASIDLSNYATKTDTVLETTLSRGRKEGTTVGEGSFAFGYNVEASANYSYAVGYMTAAQAAEAHAEGAGNIASGGCSHVEGANNIASGQHSHAEGGHVTSARGNKAIGQASHVEGTWNIANGKYSHVEGYYNIGNAAYSHVGGKFNIEDTHNSWPEWVANTEYVVGDKVKLTTTENNETTITGYICKTANNDAEFTVANWDKDGKINYVEIIGNGTANDARSNARALDWDGNEHLMGDVYVHANANSTGGTKLAKITDVPANLSDLTNDTNFIAPATQPIENGTALVYANGIWTTQPGYGYSTTTDSFVMAEFTASDFTEYDTRYVASIPMDQDLQALLERMFFNKEEFNVKINDTVYNSVADEFTYTEAPSIYLEDTNSNKIFELALYGVNMGLYVSTVPTNAKVYGSTTTYTVFDNNLLPNNNIAKGTGDLSVALNQGNTASGESSVAEGYSTYASGLRSHAEGSATTASGNMSHAEGSETKAFGTYSHAEGYNTLAGGQYSHSEGINSSLNTSITITAEVDATNQIYSVEYIPSVIKVDNFILATDTNGQDYVQIIDIDSENLQIKLSKRVLTGQYNVVQHGAFGEASHTEGTGNIAIGISSHAEGYVTKAKGAHSHAEGWGTNASSHNSHAEGYKTISGDTSHSEGELTMANAYISHAEGYQTITVYRLQDGRGTHAEGYITAAFGDSAHSEGSSGTSVAGVKVLLTGEQAVTDESHTLNYDFPQNSTAKLNSDVVGMYLVYTGEDFVCNCLKITAIDTSQKTFQVINSHPALTDAVFMLVDNIAIGKNAHTEGVGTQAIGDMSHAEGNRTIANGPAQHVQGKYNIEDTNKTYAHIVGNGTSSARSNAHTLDWNGNAWYAGNLTVNGGSITLHDSIGDVTITAAQLRSLLATLQ